MFGLDAPELIVIAIVIILLFGYKKLPDATRALGRSMRIFKAEARGLSDEDRAIEARHAEAQATGETTAHESRLADGTGVAPAPQAPADSEPR
jgi:sec-independent protein translocase protein TatA